MVTASVDDIDPKLLMTFTGHTDYVFTVFVSRTDGFLYSGSNDQTIKKWNTNNGENMLTFTGHSAAVCSGLGPRATNLLSFLQ
jgi:WD40 repeat protein